MGKILLNSRRSKRSVNVDNKITLEFKNKESILPVNECIGKIDSYDVYNDERDKSSLYRIILSINPICSNILFNSITEIVYKEGSEDIVVVPINVSDSIKYNDFKGEGNPISTESLYTRQCIRDTEYTHPKIGPYVYHCGYDMFNNHTLRTSDFISINNEYDANLLNNELKNDKKIENLYGGTEYNVSSTFNTIRDYVRYANGEPLREIYFNRKNVNVSSIVNMNNRIIHNYQTDNLYTFIESINNNMSEDNGWFGFVNPSYIDIGDNNLLFNKCMNNNKSCEFIDMYPDRSLFSFIPKINEYRNNRVEKNWEYCLTYPYKNNFDNELIYENGINGIKVTNNNIKLININERSYLVIKSPLTHNLKYNSNIQIYVKDDNSMYEKVNFSCKVEGIGDLNGNDEKHTFFINSEDLIQYLDYYDNLIHKDIRFAKIVNGLESSYYIREFKRLPNLKYSKKNIDSIEDENLDAYINNSLFIKNNNKYSILDFNNSINKIAFSQNIYGDNISQIIYTDDINVNRLKDNLNRPLSEIYLTIIKNNKGYDKWYYEKDYSSDSIEFSHAFGKITAGIDMDDTQVDYNVHCIHNINIYENNKECDWNSILKIPESGKIIKKPKQIMINDDGLINEVIPDNDDININDTVFLGDIVEYIPSEVKEYTIEKIYYRFNTAQREIVFNDERENIYIDTMVNDDYDLDDNSNVTGENGYNNNIGFKISEDIFNKTDDNFIYPGNLFPEGYFYLPHYKIKINDFSNIVNQGEDTIIKYYKEGDKKPIIDKYIKINTINNYYLNVNERIILYNKEDKKYTYGIIVKIENNFKTITFKPDIKINNNELGNYIIFKKNTEIPYYAYRLNDGSGRYLWRTILKKSEIPYNSDIYNMIFANNAFYIHNNINFYLKRQDPYGNYGLKYVEGKTSSQNRLSELDITGNKKDITIFDYVKNENNNLC